MCEHHPCWPTPAEAQKLIDMGHGARLMLDWWEPDSKMTGPDGGRVYLLCPAESGRERGSAREFSFADLFSRPNWRCTFLEPQGTCALHAVGAKPIEGRLATCAKGEASGDPFVSNLHYRVAATWNTSQGREVVALWKRVFYREDVS